MEGEECGQEGIIGDGGVPAIGGEDGGAEFLAGQAEPGETLVVEVGEGAFFSVASRTHRLWGRCAGSVTRKEFLKNPDTLFSLVAFRPSGL
jgi:hypothetical protein